MGYQTPYGMHDILPEEQPYWDALREAFERVARRYGFGRLDTPILEYTAVFTKGVGEGTDIVDKEMYYFEDKEFSLGLRNDDKNLFLCLTIDNPMMRAQALTRGLTVWFDPDGGRAKTFGIQFPIGRPDASGTRRPVNRKNQPMPVCKR